MSVDEKSLFGRIVSQLSKQNWGEFQLGSIGPINQKKGSLTSGQIFVENPKKAMELIREIRHLGLVLHTSYTSFAGFPIIFQLHTSIVIIFFGFSFIHYQAR